MAEQLTPQQRQAVEQRGGRLLVSAAAGSGKTKVLVDRLMSYLTDPADPANIDDFLVITFTKAAAEELRGKIAAKLTERIAEEPENRHLQQQLQRLYMTNISTVHSFCGTLLRQYAYRLDLSADFRTADENECRQLRDEVMTRVLEDAYDRGEPDFCFFVDTQSTGRNDKSIPEIIEKVYDSARCHLDPAGWLQECMEAVDNPGITDATQTRWGQLLIEELFAYLDLQIDAIDRCVKLASDAQGGEGVATLFADTLVQLRYLRAAQTWDEIVRRKNIEYGTLRFKKDFDDEDLKIGLKVVREACKKGLAKYTRRFSDPSEQVLKDLRSSASAVRGMVNLVIAFGDAYDKTKQSHRILDFSDLEHRTLDLLLGKKRSGTTSLAREIGSRFREVMVDEYQDSNAVQDAIYMALTEKRQNCFMVGDVKQSIYQFRLADPGIFLHKYDQYPAAEDAAPGEPRKVMLSQNFRSGGAVLSAVNSVFEKCMSPAIGGLYYGKDEALYEGIPHEPLGEPEVELYGIETRQASYPEEAAFTAQRIQELLDGSHMIRDKESIRPIREEDIVILLRSRRTMAPYYLDALNKAGIRCFCESGVNLLKADEIIVLRSLLQTIQNPQLDIPLFATLASPVFGFSANDLALFRSVDRKCSVFDALKRSESEKCKSFVAMLQCLRRDARLNDLPQLLESIFDKTRMDSIYGAMEDGQIRAENLQTFYQIAVDFASAGQGDLGRFLERVDAMEEEGLFAGAEGSNRGCVTIMSVHKSKGLEFPVVFLGGLSNAFNHKTEQAQVLCHKDLGIGMPAADTERRVRYPNIAKWAISKRLGQDGLSEELRILYVAMTRARDRLIMTYASKKLAKELEAMVQRINMGATELLIRDVSCPGDWVLLTALGRTEAGEFFRLGGKPEQTRIGDHPWLIRVVQAPEAVQFCGQVEEKTGLSEAVVDWIRQGLQFTYAHPAATAAPSKQTATQRKGRLKDQEAAENAGEVREPVRAWRKPSFVEEISSARAYGDANHAAMQYIRYEACTDAAGVEQEIRRLVDERFITAQQGDMVDCGTIAAFFATPLGRKLKSGQNVLREFKFSILDDGSAYGDGLEGEKILLQGVVDCALMEEDGITVVDFKTDRVTEDTVAAVAERYRPQVEAYADALCRIFEKWIKGKCLYFFHLGQFVEL